MKKWNIFCTPLSGTMNLFGDFWETVLCNFSMIDYLDIFYNETFSNLGISALTTLLEEITV